MKKSSPVNGNCGPAGMVFFLAILAAHAVLFGCSRESPPPASSKSPAVSNTVSNVGSAVTNHPPSIVTASIFPTAVSLDSTLRVEVRGEDEDGERLSYRYQWMVNRAVIPDAVGPDFATERLRKGDEVTVKVIPNDGQSDGSAYITAPVVVGNTPPSITEILLEPVPLHRAEILRARVQATDPDSDQVQLSYKWYRNGKEVPAAVSDTLDTKVFRKKDILTVLVSASDGNSTRDPLMSNPVEIQNSAPKILSTPPTTMSDGQYAYQITAKDPDDDPVTYELKQGPDGMTMDAASGKLMWKITPESSGKHQVVVVAKDSEGASTSQDFQLQLSP
jgi:hypothetical protein